MYDPGVAVAADGSQVVPAQPVTVQPMQPAPQSPAPAQSSSLQQSDTARLASLLADAEKSMQGGRYDQARNTLMNALQMAPNDGQCLLGFGVCSLALGNFGDAASALHETININPDLARTTLDLRQRFGASGNFGGLRRTLEEVAKSQPNGSPSQFLLGYVQFFGGEAVAGRETLKAYSSANTEDTVIKKFLSVAERVTPPSQG